MSSHNFAVVEVWIWRGSYNVARAMGPRCNWWPRCGPADRVCCMIRQALPDDGTMKSNRWLPERHHSEVVAAASGWEPYYTCLRLCAEQWSYSHMHCADPPSAPCPALRGASATSSASHTSKSEREGPLFPATGVLDAAGKAAESDNGRHSAGFRVGPFFVERNLWANDELLVQASNF